MSLMPSLVVVYAKRDNSATGSKIANQGDIFGMLMRASKKKVFVFFLFIFLKGILYFFQDAIRSQLQQSPNQFQSNKLNKKRIFFYFSFLVKKIELNFILEIKIN